MSSDNSARVFLGLGGNIGDPARAMADALQALDATLGTSVAAVSSLHRTPPWGKVDQPDFLNIVAEIRTDLRPHALLQLCLDIERSQRRIRRERWGPRTIDIDILIYDDLNISEEGLEIPHPRMAERAFVLVPLAEIAPDQLVDGKPAHKLLSSLDTSGIVRQPGGRDWWRG
ncbi:2-amino-4-hydroxy-6-hydroxymethyldihydropteridine diphosphokinase [Mesorhizobium sp. J18]|uniref:2-amino-4-hydroxy-6- hydroxymethyldihydropteridine diphosphokinase n=1 Tax=Mesorhizobium sp. J18 TaxID=935263 RepID=UPI00119AF0A4|nr:2-amino-4-hydroxy-6-hydroxymethyldihydropteridine diphosphokinase [Mesorhizobium sp. J18]TWG93822.1 2-amino-4-hydroxy-6-hydroxymethyldihydropteridine diphosphokinase [Mesorhizobium sp. J18]